VVIVISHRDLEYKGLIEKVQPQHVWDMLHKLCTSYFSLTYELNAFWKFLNLLQKYLPKCFFHYPQPDDDETWKAVKKEILKNKPRFFSLYFFYFFFFYFFSFLFI
jgi:hypothetical protein